jgi:D-3-phosphoglycerate dehydrogenase
MAYDPFVKEANLTLDIHGTQGVDVKISTVPLDQLISSADVITMHVPGGKMISEKEINQMKNGVIVINASRGGVIDETDLLAGLHSGKIAHACLDVFENEPTPNESILKHAKISLTPHIGAATNEAQERIGVELAEKLIEALK